ncbi:protein transport Sec1a-like [Impatiens glandulifera]|uniref:protein transport Sec1a-like n=1 Tax=Impatiens glandulifera TaxID=253017 RepID=UPI001FB12C84|nr:protein transport Sec1a-like [Impatiens glandulifera]
MSFSDSECSSNSGDYKTFRQTSRARLLYEMLRASKTGDSKAWKVLIMDKVTVKVMSASCKMADITDEGVSLVEDLFRRRQPLPSMDAIYFIQPSKENVVMLLSDMSGREPLYRKAFIYFCSPIPKDLLGRIKNDTSIVPRIGALREVTIIICFTLKFILFQFFFPLFTIVPVVIELQYKFITLWMQMNLEYFSMDSQGYTTDQETALGELFRVDAEKSYKYKICMTTMATRIATVFASLKEHPVVRYRAAKSDAAPNHHLLSTKVAASVWECIQTYKTTIPNYPQSPTCDLLILDRSFDQIAPIIHEWTYDAMCHDLLELEGNKYIYEVPSKHGGDPEKKEFLLEDHDAVWLELRHTHIADASERLHDKMTNFVSKNKAAQLQNKDSSEMSTRDLQKMVQDLPQYNEQMEKLSLHVQIAGKLNRQIKEMDLRELGQLEQDIVFGDAGTKEVINFLRAKQDASTANKLRLVMIYAFVNPDKFEGDKATKLMQLANLTNDDMKAVKNMIMLEGADARKATTSGGGFSLKFDNKKQTNLAARKDRAGEEETWQLFRFFPVLEELIEKLNKGELPKDEFQCMNEGDSSSNMSNGSGAPNSSAKPNQPPAPHSMRSRRTPGWAKRNSDDGYSSDSALKAAATNDFKRMGKRIFIFIIGGATRSELRVCHKLTTKLKREVVLGTTNMEDPPQYLPKLKVLSDKEPEPQYY